MCVGYITMVLSPSYVGFKKRILWLETKNEKERIWEIYETIALKRSHSQLMVQEAMGSSSAAGRKIQEFKSLFDVNQDSDYV